MAPINWITWAVTDNQPTLLQQAEALCASRHPESSDTSVTKGRNRQETRTADVFSTARARVETEWSSLIKRFVRVTRDVLHRSAKTGLWSSTSEVAYYVANSAASARQAGNAIRGHWHIENTLHYTRDVTFREDQSRIRHNPGIFARLEQFPTGWNRDVLSRIPRCRWSCENRHPDIVVEAVMPRPYSIDLRERVIAAVTERLSVREVGEIFDVSPSFVSKLAQRWRRSGRIDPLKSGGDRRSGALEAQRDWLLQTIEATPDLTLREIRDR